MNKIFRTRGPLTRQESYLYVEREEDGKVAECVHRGEYVTLIGARQTGKTSLLQRLYFLLEEEGHIPVYIDLSPSRDKTGKEWYDFLHRKIAQQLKRRVACSQIPPMHDADSFFEALRVIGSGAEGHSRVKYHRQSRWLDCYPLKGGVKP